MTTNGDAKYTTLDEIEKIHDELKAEFLTGKSKDIAYRKQQLLQLSYMLHDNLARFDAALTADLGRASFENNFLEFGGCFREAKEAYENVAKWAKPEKVPMTLNWFATHPTIRKEAKGVVLIISPFNYPVFLCILPMVGAIAAGNAVVLKPSEISASVGALFAELVPKYLDPKMVSVVTGGVPETTKLLELKWDHIMYTGNGRVGRIVATAAAKHLTPITLELGGKSPAFIDPRCDLSVAARRIAWGKFSNSGQTCTAPDYVIIPKDAQDKFIAVFKEVTTSFFPEGARKSPSYARIVSTQHHARLQKMLTSTHGTVVFGGPAESDVDDKYIAPTLVKDVKGDDILMQEELFGPILPIVAVKDLDEAIEFVRGRDAPLALYVFSRDKAYKQKVFDNTQSGAAIANDVVVHMAVDYLPFGGIGESGQGTMTGKFSFDTFTHLRASMDTPNWMDKILGKRYPPYTPANLKFFRTMLTPKLPPRDGVSSSRRWWKRLGLAALVSAVLYALRVSGKAKVKK